MSLNNISPNERVLIEGKIVSGPSREELFDALKYFMLEVHRVGFTFTHPSSDGTIAFGGRILGIECEDGSMQSWVLKVELDRLIDAHHDPAIMSVLTPETFSLLYNTHRRTGRIIKPLSGELTISGKISRRGGQRPA